VYLIDVLLNVTYITLLGGGCIIYVFLKHRTSRAVKEYLGGGDLLLWVCFALWFVPFQFMVFSTLSFIAAFLLHAVFRASISAYRIADSIPLAGMQSIFFIPILFYF
jgi:hypothetical protein